VDMGLAVTSDGALCVFPPGFTGREDEPLPLIIRKSDRGYNYATTDLATIRYRVDTEHVDRIIYVVGSAQELHFRMVFAVARMAGWLPEHVVVEHAGIGNVQGDDGKVLRTRAGGTVKLIELLDEAVQRAGQEVGIGAVKYADLSVARDSDYVFDLDKMLSLKGNTGPYLQYAGVRIRSIFDKAGLAPESATGPVVIGHQAERARPAPAGLRRGTGAGGRVHRAAPAGGLPLRTRHPLHGVPRELPGAQGTRRGDQGIPAGPGRGDAAHVGHRPAPPRRPHTRTDVRRRTSVPTCIRPVSPR